MKTKLTLFFLADQAILLQCEEVKQVTCISSKGETALFRIQGNDTTSRCLCTPEEGDTRLLLPALYASAEGYKRVMFWTVDTDI